MSTKISRITSDELIKLHNTIYETIQGSNYLEDAAQKYMSLLYDNLSDSIVLARLFATVCFNELPETNKKFVLDIANAKNVGNLINKDSLVLSLLGTRGVAPEWNARIDSRGHIGIPLVSSEFIEKIPMMSRLLHELGIDTQYLNADDKSLFINTIKDISGIFYVGDAATALDYQGRKIIAAQDFVKEYNVKTVFGIGGGYIGNPVFFVTIFFLRETLEKYLAQKFMLQANKFKTATFPFIEENKIFTQ